MNRLDILKNVNTPSYVVDERKLRENLEVRKLRENLEVLQAVQNKTGCHILLAQKAFSMFYFYPMIGRYISGATARGIFEAKLAHEFMPGKENHVFSPAYKEKRILLKSCRFATILFLIRLLSGKNIKISH